MRIAVWCRVLLLSCLLSGCVAPLLVGAQSDLMWALLKPVVGLDPKDVNLFDQSLIKDRLQPLLGDHYNQTVSLLKTADELQQEGPLFYVLSQNALTQPLANKAGFVWNSDTNQMAVLLQDQGKTQLFSEPQTGGTAKTPVWPQAMQGLLTSPASGAAGLVGQALGSPASAAGQTMGSLLGNATSAASQGLDSAVSSASHTAAQGMSNAASAALSMPISAAASAASSVEKNGSDSLF